MNKKKIDDIKSIFNKVSYENKVNVEEIINKEKLKTKVNEKFDLKLFINKNVNDLRKIIEQMDTDFQSIRTSQLSEGIEVGIKKSVEMYIQKLGITLLRDNDDRNKYTNLYLEKVDQNILNEIAIKVREEIKENNINKISMIRDTIENQQQSDNLIDKITGRTGVKKALIENLDLKLEKEEVEFNHYKTEIKQHRKEAKAINILAELENEIRNLPEEEKEKKEKLKGQVEFIRENFINNKTKEKFTDEEIEKVIEEKKKKEDTDLIKTNSMMKPKMNMISNYLYKTKLERENVDLRYHINYAKERKNIEKIDKSKFIMDYIKESEENDINKLEYEIEGKFNESAKKIESYRKNSYEKIMELNSLEIFESRKDKGKEEDIEK